MKYILREIESEEEFQEVFGRKSGWVVSPTTLNKSIKRREQAPPNTKHSREQKSIALFRKLFFWRRKC